MDILVANHRLENVGGTESFTLTIAKELHNRNHHVEYFTFYRGEISNLLEEIGVNFMSKKKYDLILANHNTCVRALKKRGLVIQTCHGIYPELEQPSNDAYAHVAISVEIQNHLASKGFFSKLIFNPIDTEKFIPTKPTNENLTNVLSLCHSNEAHNLVEDCCKELNLNFKKFDKYLSPSFNIEKDINESDIVIGLGRSLYEAMSCGRPVISYDYRKQYMESYGDGYLKDILGFSLLNNCSGRYTKNTYNKEKLKVEILKYNYSDGIFLRNIIVENFDVRKKVDEYISYYESILSINPKIFLKKLYSILFLKKLV